MNAKLALLSVVVASTFAAQAASAGTIQIGGQAAGAAGKISAQPGVCTVTFDTGTAANTCGVTYSPSEGNNYRTGSVAGRYASPAGDTTGFFTVGPQDGTPVTIRTAALDNYFGFYAGSLDSFNLVQFYLNGALVDSFTGTQINAVAFPGSTTDGNQTQAQYIDYFLPSGQFYNSIVYSSSNDAFETDSHAFGVATPRGVPEPESIALLGLGALGLALARRRKAA